MEIVNLNRKLLNDYIHSDEYKIMSHLPISFHRGISHINNPRINDDDTLLILVYEKELIGYLGIIPDQIFINNVAIKMGWMSCIWIHSKARGKGIAKKLTEKAIELYKDKIFATEYTPVAEKLYQKLGKFDPLVNKAGVRIFRRSCFQTVLPARHPKTSFLFPFLSFYDATVNFFHDPFLRKKHKLSSNYSVEFPSEPDESCYYLMNNLSQMELLKREQKEIEWSLKYPWIKETPAQTTDSKRYQFSSEARKFKTILVKIKQGIELVSFLIVTIREKHLKTPYLYVKPGHEAVISEILNNLMYEHKIDILTTYQKSVIPHIEKNIPYLFSKNIIRKYLQSKGFNITVKENQLQDGDGDCGFV
jgi:GNAT superfamily N-acetyltransferase